MAKLVFLNMRRFFLILLVAAPFFLKGQTVSFTKPSSGKFDSHVVLQGETLYSVSKKYHTTVDSLLKLNPDIINNDLALGKVIRVPIVRTDVAAGSNGPDKKIDNPLFYRVGKGETVFSISKKYNTDVNTILMWNDLKEPAIKEGQMLIVGYAVPKMNLIGPLPMESTQSQTKDFRSNVSAVNTEVNSKTKSDTVSINKNASSGDNLKVVTKKENEILHDEKGIARWTHSTYDDGNFYALHATAPPGTEISVKNLMNNKTITVKVIGRLPATSGNENVLINLSESAAKKLNVFDDKFLVEITYMAPEIITASELN